MRLPHLQPSVVRFGAFICALFIFLFAFSGLRFGAPSQAAVHGFFTGIRADPVEMDRSMRSGARPRQHSC